MSKTNIPVAVGAKIPPTGIRPATAAEPQGLCVKCKKQPGTLRSPSGAMYCFQCGHCTRKEYIVINGAVMVRNNSECTITVDQFVMHPRMGIYVCPCIICFEDEIQHIRSNAS